MKLKNTQDEYGLIAKSLHWMMAVIIFALFAVGLYMTSLTYYDPLYHTLPWWHKSFGLAVAILLMLRLIWKFNNTNPAHLSTHTRMEILLAGITHKMLYTLIIVICISGYLISTAEGKGIEFFGWFEIPAVMAPVENQADTAGLIHLILAYIMAALVVLHIAGAVKHHLLDKDNTLKRML